MKTTFTLKQGWIVLCLFVSASMTTNLYADAGDLFAIYCPDDVTVDCAEELSDLSAYGQAYYHDYSGEHSAGTPTVHYNLNSCNTGTITRTWRVEDYNWNWHSCTQTITVGANGGFNYNSIHWPQAHIEIEGCDASYHPNDLPAEYSWPTYNYAECSLVGVDYDDQEFFITNQCTKILRTWKVIDWCAYDESNDYGHGLYTFQQTIKISKGAVPEIDFADEIDFGSFNCKDKEVTVPPLYIAPATCGGDFTITNDSPYAYENGADISGVYPIGTTRVRYTVRYGCVGRKYHYVDIKVEDRKGPLPYCLAEVITAMMPMDEDGDGHVDNGMVEIWAKDLDWGSSSPCGHYPLKFSFSEDPADDVKVFDCNSVGDNYIRLYVTDRKGNQNWCQVNVVVQNNGANIPNCEDAANPSYATVAGRVVMENQAEVANAQVKVRSMEPILHEFVGWDTVSTIVTHTVLNAQGYWEERSRYEDVPVFGNHVYYEYAEAEVTTDEAGQYLVDESVRTYGDYMLTAQYEDDASSIDLADIKALYYHLQGKETFTDAYQYLAADLNQNGEIDHNDLAQLMQYVAGHSNAFSCNKEWVLVDASQEFTNPTDIISGDCPEAIYFSSNAEGVTDKNFIAVRLGELSDEIIIDNNVLTAGNTSQHLSTTNNSSSMNEEQLDALLRSLEDSPNTISAYPNPFNDKLYISYEAMQAEKLNIEIRDITGKLLLQQNESAEVGNNLIALDLSSDYEGIVLCTIESESITRTFRVIKK